MRSYWYRPAKFTYYRCTQPGMIPELCFSQGKILMAPVSVCHGRLQRRRPGHSRAFRRPQLVAAVVLALALVPLVDATTLSTSAATGWHSSDGSNPVIHVDAGRRSRLVHRNLLGVNTRWFRDGDGVWNEATSAPRPIVVKRARAVGIRAMRYPGGSVAAMFNWKNAVGDSRGCQINGHANRGDGFWAAAHAKLYGPSEYMQFSHAVGAETIIMAPFIRESPADAADWVEYMNSRVGANRNGGLDWAKVRAADGHPAPYNVRRWEVGNESNVGPARFGFSRKPYTAVRQYAFGGVRHVRHESLGKGCDHRGAGVPSNGKRNQVFSVLYEPFETRDLAVNFNGFTWRRVQDLSNFGPFARVYTVRPQAGEIIFGDGVHGKIPRQGAVGTAAYTNRFPGFFRFYRAMKAVDPSINVCASWGTPAFARVVGARDYDCLTAHPIMNFRGTNTDNWSGPLAGHDRMMLGLEARHKTVVQLRRGLPRNTPLLLTEFNAIKGNYEAFPYWSASASHAIYMASMYVMLLKLGVSWANGGDFMTSGEGAVIGPSPEYTISAEANVRRALLPMFTAGGRLVHTGVGNNPIRSPQLRNAGNYSALNVTAIRHLRQLWVVAVNRLPGRAITARVEVSAFQSRRKAFVRRVSSRYFTSWNHPGKPPTVRLHTFTRTVGPSGFTVTLPPHSVTAFRLVKR